MAKGISAEAREDILVQAFLTCPNISEISKKTKIPRPTIYTVIHSDSFQRKYSEARNEAVTGAIAYLQGKLGECAAVLVNTATDAEVPAQIRVNAANAALSQCSQWTKNVDVIERLKAMEILPSSLSAMIRQSSGCFSASLRIADLYRPCENDKVALVPLVINSITFSLHPSIKISFLFCSSVV